MKHSIIVVLLAALLAGIEPVQAVTPGKADAISIPPMLNYQGKLTDAAGNPINGTRDMTFRLYADSVGGNPLWTETQTVAATSGLFNVQLGSVTPIAAVPAGPDCFLEVTVAGEAVAPRIRLLSSTYSYNAAKAEDANSLGGIPANGYVRGVTASAPLTSTGGQNPNLTLNATMGGDLTGSYPNPALVNTGVAAGIYGGDTLVPQLTVDAKGRIAGATNIRLGGSTTGPYGNIQRVTSSSGTFYTVPSGRSFLLYGMAGYNYGNLTINGGSVMFVGPIAVNFNPPIQYPAGTQLGNGYNGNYLSIWGYEGPALDGR